MRIHVVSSEIKAVSKEVSRLCGKIRPSLLRKTSKEDLHNFDLQKLCEEWRERAPILFFTRSTWTLPAEQTVEVLGLEVLHLQDRYSWSRRNREMNATAAVMGILLKSKAAEVILIYCVYRAESKWVSGMRRNWGGFPKIIYFWKL